MIRCSTEIKTRQRIFHDTAPLKEIQKAQDEDGNCKELMKYCKYQWPDKDHVTRAVKPYWSVQGELTIVDGLLLKGARLVIPSSLQRHTLN